MNLWKHSGLTVRPMVFCHFFHPTTSSNNSKWTLCSLLQFCRANQKIQTNTFLIWMIMFSKNVSMGLVKFMLDLNDRTTSPRKILNQPTPKRILHRPTNPSPSPEALAALTFSSAAFKLSRSAASSAASGSSKVAAPCLHQSSVFVEVLEGTPQKLVKSNPLRWAILKRMETWELLLGSVVFPQISTWFQVLPSTPTCNRLVKIKKKKRYPSFHHHGSVENNPFFVKEMVGHLGGDKLFPASIIPAKWVHQWFINLLNHLFVKVFHIASPKTRQKPAKTEATRSWGVENDR